MEPPLCQAWSENMRQEMLPQVWRDGGQGMGYIFLTQRSQRQRGERREIYTTTTRRHDDLNHEIHKRHENFKNCAGGLQLRLFFRLLRPLQGQGNNEFYSVGRQTHGYSFR